MDTNLTTRQIYEHNVIYTTCWPGNMWSLEVLTHLIHCQTFYQHYNHHHHQQWYYTAEVFDITFPVTKSRSMSASSLSLISNDSVKSPFCCSSLLLSSDTMILAVLRFRTNPPSLDDIFAFLPLLFFPVKHNIYQAATATTTVVAWHLNWNTKGTKFSRISQQSGNTKWA